MTWTEATGGQQELRPAWRRGGELEGPILEPTVQGAGPWGGRRVGSSFWSLTLSIIVFFRRFSCAGRRCGRGDLVRPIPSNSRKRLRLFLSHSVDRAPRPNPSPPPSPPPSGKSNSRIIWTPDSRSKSPSFNRAISAAAIGSTACRGFSLGGRLSASDAGLLPPRRRVQGRNGRRRCR